MAEKLTVSAIDNDVLAQVILGDTLRTVYFKSGSIPEFLKIGVFNLA